MNKTRESAIQIQNGKNVKLVGLNHSGKTTLLKALGKELAHMNPILENTCGQMKVNGSDANHNLFLVDEAITMFSPWYGESLRVPYKQRLSRLHQNGSSAVFALHKENNGFEDEFDSTFPNCSRIVLNAQMPQEVVEAIIRSKELRSNGISFLLDESAVKKLMHISGRTILFIDRVFDSLGDMLEDWPAKEKKIILSAQDIDARSIVLISARKPSNWVSKLDPSEVSFLKDIILGINSTSNCKEAEELVALGILGIRNGSLIIPGSAPFASIKATIEMDEQD